MSLKDLQQNVAAKKAGGTAKAKNTSAKNTSSKSPVNKPSSYKKYDGKLTQERYNELRDKGYTKEEIQNAYMKGNPQMTQELYNHLRDQGYSKKEIEKGHYDREFLIPWRTQKTAGSSFGNWGRDVDAFTSWSDKNSGDISKYDLKTGTTWESTFRKNANKARDYMIQLQQAGISPDTDEFNAYKQYYDYFSGMARNLSQNNKSFTDYRSNFMYNAGEGSYLNYADAKAQQRQLQNQEQGYSGRAYKPDINDYIAPGAYYDNETYEQNMKQYKQDLAAWETHNANAEKLSGLNSWIANQDEQKAQSDWLTRNLGSGQDSEKVYQSYADRMAAADTKKSELESKRPDYYSYGISDELGNVYAYNDEAYNKDVNAWSTEYNNYMRNVYYPTQKQFNYASDARYMSVIKNANVDSPEVKSIIARGKRRDNPAQTITSSDTSSEEPQTFADRLGNFLDRYYPNGIGGSSVSGTGGVNQLADINKAMYGAYEGTKHADTSTWEDNQLNDQLNAYYFLRGLETQDNDEAADRLAQLTNNAIAKIGIQNEIYAPMDKFQEDHPLLGGAAAFAAETVLPLYLGIPETLAMLDNYMVTGEIDTNAASLMPTRLAERASGNTVRQLNNIGTVNNAVPVIGGKGLGDAYQLAISIAQSALSRMMAGFRKGMPISAADEKAMSKFVLTQFFGSASSAGIMDALDRGLSPEQAIALGTLNGVNEALGETISFDKIVDIHNTAGAKNLIKMFLTQGGIEGSEEAFTTVLNTLSDMMVTGDKNELETAKQSYISQGMSKEAAEKQAIKDWLNGMAFDFVGGFISGGVSAGGQAIGANIGRYQGNVSYLNDLSTQTAEGSRSRQMAEDYGTREKLSAYRGNQYAEQVKQDLITQNTDTAVRAIEQRLTELGETGNVHQKAQDIANAVVGAMTDEEAGGWAMRPSDQISATATANMRQVVDELATAREQYVDYSKPDSSWTDPIMKGRFLDQRILSGNQAYNALYNAERKAENTLKEHTAQVTDLSEQILEAKKELGRLSPTDSTRRTELNNKIREAEKELKSHQDAILSDGRNIFTEEQKAASVDIDGKEYKVSGLTMADGQTQAKLTDADGNTMNVSIEDERLPAEFRNLALKVNTLGWAASMAFEHYKTGTDIRNYIYRVQAIQAFASEKISREAFMNSSAVKALNDSVLAEFLYSHGQELYNERQAKVKKAAEKLNEKAQNAMEKTGDIDNVRTKGKGNVDIKSGWTAPDGTHYAGIQGKKLSAKQNAVVRMIDYISDAVNLDYIIFDGDAKGVQGIYHDGGTIAININAGLAKLTPRVLAAETLSHELTHFEGEYAPEEFEVLREAVINAAFEGNQELFEQRVQAQMRMLGPNFQGDRHDQAVKEVIAESCTTMLQNSKVVTEIARQNMTVAQKMADFIEQTINKIKQAIADAFADSDPSSYRKEVALIEKDMDRIQKLWDAALEKAVFNYNAAQTIGDTDSTNTNQLQMNESDEGTISVDANPVVSSLVNTMKPHNGASLIQYQMATENEAMPKQIFSVGGDSMMLTDADGKNLSFSVRDIRDAVARANGMSDANIAKVNGFLDELGSKMKDYELKYQFVGLKDIEDAKILLDRDGKIILSAMVKNNEYAVNFDFTKLCKKRQALQKVIENLAREKGRVTENGSITEVNLTAGNVQHINELLAAAGVETNCLGCFVEAKRANQQQLNGYIINDWNAIVDELYPNAKYFNFADKTGDVNLHDSTTDKEAFEKYREALRQLGEEKKKQRKSITPVEKARLLIENVPAARFKLKYSDLATENGRTRLHQEFPEIDSYAKSRLGTASFKTVESFAPYNAEIELLGQGASIKVKDGKITVKKDNGNLRKQLAKIAGVRSQSFSDFIVSHVYDVMQKTAALSARGLPAHTYTKEISRARLFGMTGEKHNLSVLLEVDPSVDSWSAGLTQNGDFFAGDYQHFALKEGQIGKAHFIQSIGLEDAKKLQNTEGYSKNCGIIVVPLSYNAYIKALNDPEMRMIIGYHSSGMPVDVKSKTHYDMAADYQGVQNTQKVVRLVKPNYAIPEGIPSYATPPGDVVPLDGKSKTLRSDMSFDIKARFEELAKGKTGNERTAAAKQTLQEFLDFMNENGLTAETTKSENGYGKFPLYDDVQQTRDPYLTADHYIEYCIEKGELPLFWEFATNQNYYKQVFDFNMFDRLSYNEKTGRHESSPTREAYAPQVAVQLLDNNGDLLVPRDFFDLLDKYMKDYNAQMEKVSSVVPEVIEAVKTDKNIVSVAEQRQVAEAEAEAEDTTAQYQLADGETENAIYIKDGHTEDGKTVDFINEILDGRKKGETRTHKRLTRKWVGMAKNGLVYGRVRLGNPIEITNKSPEYKDAMIEGTEYDLKDGETKYYYPVLETEDMRDNPRPITKNGNYGKYQYQMADQEYMDAVNSGNTEEQQRMVDEAARATGYTIRAYHGSPHTDISVFDINRAGENTGVYGDRAMWFTDSESFADEMSYQQLEGSSAFRSRRGSKGKVYDTYLKINRPFDIRNMTPAMRDLLWEMNLSKLRSMGMEPEQSSMGNRDYFFESIDAALEAGNDQYVKFYVDYSMLRDAGYDGIIARLFTNFRNDDSVEYGVFSPEQIKSADPVTYDGQGNVIPLSQRFNANNPQIQYQMYDNSAQDSMFEAEERQKAWNDLQAENTVLEDTVTQLRKEIAKLTKETAQLRKTDKPEVRMNDARKMARQTIKDTRPEPITTRDKAEIREMTNRLSQQIKEIGDYILETGKNPNEMDYSTLRSMAQEIADDIVSNAEVEIDDGGATKDMRGQMRSALKRRAIFVPEQYRSDVLDWNDFKKRYRNVFSFKDNGTDIDIVYQSLLEEVPGLLDPNINNPGDMLNELADKWDLLQPKYENPFDDFTNEAINHYTNMILQGALDGTLRQIAPTYADRMNSRIEQIRNEGKEKVKAARAEGAAALEALRTEKNARIEEIRQQGIARKQEALAKERADKWERVEATREYYQEMAKRATIRRKNSETRTKVKKLIADLNSRLTHPTEKKYVPADLVNNTIKILEMIDLDTGKESVRVQERIALLQQQYAALKGDQTFAGYAYDPIMEDAITNMARQIGNTPLRKMSSTQLDTVYNTLRTLEHTIRTAVKDNLYGEEWNFYEAGKAAVKATKDNAGTRNNALGNAADWYTTNTMRPQVVFERFGGFAKGSEWERIYDMLDKAQRYGMDLQMKFAMPFEELLKDKKELAKLTSSKESDLLDIGLKDENGETIKVTRDFMLFVYMNLFNEDNIQHVMRGGIECPELKEYLSGKGDRGYGKGSRRAVGISPRLHDINEAIEKSTDANEKAALLEEKENLLKEGMEYINTLRENIEKKLTDYDKKWIQAWWQFERMSSEVLNDTSMQVYGFKKFIVEQYFPIITDRNFLNVPMDTIIKDMSLENAGFTKERIHASTPIKMMGLSDVINMQANRTAQYAAMMPAIRAFNKIYNKTMPGYSTSVKDALNKKFGDSATKFVENLMADLQGGRRADFTIFDRLRGRMAQATLSLNPRVALSQTASFPTAAAELGWKPVLKALARGGKNNMPISAADRELIAKWSSALWYRSKGGTVELGDVKNMQQASHKVMDKLGWAMNWIEFMDSATVGRLWYAAQYYVDDNFKALQKGSDAYYEKVAEAFNRTIENTQPNYTTLQRPELLRNPDALMRQISMFMTQRLQNQSILYGAAAKYLKYRADYQAGKNGVTQDDLREMRLRAVRAATSQVAAAASITIFKFLADMLLHRANAYRRKEDKTLDAESISLAMLNNFAESLVSNMWLGSELYSAAKSIITKETYYGMELSGVTTLTETVENIVKFGQKPSWNMAKKLGESLSQFLGIPAANAEKIGQGIWYWMQDAMNGEFMEAGVERTDAMNAKLLTEAYTSGDKQAIEKYSGTFEDDDDLLDSVRSYIKTGYVSKDKQTISKPEAVKLLVQAGMRQKDAEAKVQEWTCELVTGIPFSKIKDEYMAGNITQARVTELLQKYGGRDKETAERTARSYACEKDTGHPYTDLKEAYILGEVSKNVLEKAVKKYGGMNAEDTQKKLYYYDYLKENPTSDISENRAVAYMTKLKPAGIRAKDYEDILNRADADKNGSYSQAEVGSWLTEKGYNAKQADALWSAMGPTWKTGFDAWQVKYNADMQATGKGSKNGNVSQRELGPYLVQQINAGKITMEQAEGYWKTFFSKSTTTFKKWLKKNHYKIS